MGTGAKPHDLPTATSSKGLQIPKGAGSWGLCPRAPGKVSDTKWGALGYTMPCAGPWAGPEGEGRHF